MTHILGHIQSLIEKLQNPRFCQQIKESLKQWLFWEELAELKDYKQYNEEWRQSYWKEKDKNTTLRKVNKELGDQINQLYEVINLPELDYPEEYEAIAQELQDKHPQKDIKYNLIIETKDKDIPKNIAVQNFIFSFYAIEQ